MNADWNTPLYCFKIGFSLGNRIPEPLAFLSDGLSAQKLIARDWDAAPFQQICLPDSDSRRSPDAIDGQ